MQPHPFQLFFASLESSDIRPSVRDYERILTALKGDGSWTLELFRDTLMSLLTRNRDEQQDFLRRFHTFFKVEMETEETIPEIDVQRLLAEIRRRAQKSGSRPAVYAETSRGVVQPIAEPAQNGKRRRLVISLALAVLSFVAGIIFISGSILNRPMI